MARYFAELSYKGTRYHGWQVQPNALTVQELLEKALATALRREVSTTGSGRTDTGVHALQQFAHFDLEEEDPSGMLSNVNALLPEDIAVRRFIRVHDGAHARFDAISRSYLYQMHFRKDPFLHRFSWRTAKDMDLERMNRGAELIRAHTDFGCFCKSHSGAATTLCRVTRAEWVTAGGDRLEFHITANRFLRGMVRAVVGTLLDLGRGKISLDGLKGILDQGDRRGAGEAVPPEGLYLSKVEYPYLNDDPWQ